MRRRRFLALKWSRGILLSSALLLAGCASATQPYGESYPSESPALPMDPHAAQPASFTNRTEHTTLSD